MGYAYHLETDMALFSGSIEALTFELSASGPVYPSENIINAEQDWGVTVKWEIDAALVTWLNANFRVQVVLQHSGPGPSYLLPAVKVPSQNGTPTTMPPTQNYEVNIYITAGTIATGNYNIVVSLHLFDNGTGCSTPVAGFINCGHVDIF